VSKKPSAKPRWQLFAHPAFGDTFDALVTEVKRLRAAEPERYLQHPKTKLLTRLLDLIEVEIPRDPGANEYSLGNTLGPAHRHWRRAKFLGRFRLFFRYSSKAGVIIYAWVNDEKTLHQAGGRNDPYSVFSGLLRKGRPPDDWNALVRKRRRTEAPRSRTHRCRRHSGAERSEEPGIHKRDRCGHAQSPGLRLWIPGSRP
jgi:toxin YhaV